MKTQYQVTGMTCEHCERSVVRAIRQLDPKAHVVADRTANRVEVDSNLTDTQIRQAIADEGFNVDAA